MKIYSHAEQVAIIEKLQKLNLSLRYRVTEANASLDSMVENYERVSSCLTTMTTQRNEFMRLAKNLDTDFNNGSVFKRSNS